MLNAFEQKYGFFEKSTVIYIFISLLWINGSAGRDLSGEARDIEFYPTAYESFKASLVVGDVVLTKRTSDRAMRFAFKYATGRVPQYTHADFVLQEGHHFLLFGAGRTINENKDQTYVDYENLEISLLDKEIEDYLILRNPKLEVETRYLEIFENATQYMKSGYDVDPQTEDQVSCAELICKIFSELDLKLQVNEVNVNGLNRLEAKLLAFYDPSMRKSPIKDCKIPLPDSLAESPSFIKVGRLFRVDKTWKFEKYITN